jgi:acyl-CoA synthetase (AMP-forming)/AMP-acid ligase II
VDATAQMFLNAGLKTGDRVIILTDSAPPSAIAYLAAMRAGLISVPIDRAYFEQNARDLFPHLVPSAIWMRRENETSVSLPDGIRKIVGVKANPESGFHWPWFEAGLASLMVTSGSTGHPKFVMVSHANLIANTEDIVRSQNLASGDRALLILPINYCFGASVMHSHLRVGGDVVFDSRFMFPDKVLASLVKWKCQTFAGVPTTYKTLLSRSKFLEMKFPALKRLLQAGGRLEEEIVRKIVSHVSPSEFLIMYGQTEATARLTTLGFADFQRKLGSVGRPLDCVEIEIRKSDQSPAEKVPRGVEGELWARGASICQGYWATERSEKFVDGWLRTEDLAVQDADGFVWIRGRKSDFIKMKGIRVGLRDVEFLIRREFPEVDMIVAQTDFHEEAGESVRLYLVLHSEDAEFARRFKAFVVSRWVCTGAFVVASIPLGSSGKVSHEKLEGMKANARQLI